MTDGSHQLRLDSFFPLNSEGHLNVLLVENIRVVTKRVDDPRLRVIDSQLHFVTVVLSWLHAKHDESKSETSVSACFDFIFPYKEKIC